MKKLTFAYLVIFLVLLLVNLSHAQTPQTFCNPINISYSFTPDKPSRRVAADPVIVLFEDNYYLFATASGGYWHSKDLLDWVFVTTKDLPFEKDAPAAAVINGAIYYIGIGDKVIYKAIDPLNGRWEVYNGNFPMSVGDHDLFQDTDGKVYLYYGCTNGGYLQGIELNVLDKLNPIGKPVNVLTGNPEMHGWERPGDFNTLTEKPWTEGPWMTKHNGKYFYQYSAPGTQYKSYADGYYSSDNPLGPFTYGQVSPFSSKPEGFITGGGHAATFTDKYGNYWRIITMVISVKHIFERRLGLIPVTFDKNNNMIAHTAFADYPMVMPDHKIKDLSELYPSWMMLSYKKTTDASSSLPTNPSALAVDEEIRDYWSAKTGDKGEWLSVDLGDIETVNAIQINFAENNATLYGREGVKGQQYLLQYSNDNKTWKTLVDKTKNEEDLTHQYHPFKTPIKARFFKVTNYRVPSGTFAISGFRIFGKGNTKKPTEVKNFTAVRDVADGRNVTLNWDKQANATGYNIRFGVNKESLNRVYQIYGATSLTIRSLNKDQKYYFAIDAFGEGGLTKGKTK